MAATKRLNKAKKAENENATEGQDKLGGKECERELARLHGELVKLRVAAKGLKVVAVFKGRDGTGKGRGHQGDYRAGQPARLSRRRAARADRARKVSNVYPALHMASEVAAPLQLAED